MSYLFHLILFAAVVFEKGKQEAECPEAKATVSTHPSFCYHDNVFLPVTIKNQFSDISVFPTVFISGVELYPLWAPNTI